MGEFFKSDFNEAYQLWFVEKITLLYVYVRVRSV